MEAHPITMRDEFPAPRELSSTYQMRQARSLSRQVYLSKIAAKRREDSKRAPRGAIALVLLVLGALLAFNVFGGNTSLATITALGSAAAGDGSSSTPRHLWTRGAMPYLYQTDPEWESKSYAEGTVGTHGCGPTCLSMVYAELTGKRDMDPAAMADFSTQNGYIDLGVTSWLLMSQGAPQLGLAAQEVTPSADVVRARLRAGNPIICSVGPGDFTQEGHFIVLCGVDEEGRLLIRDPNSVERSQQAWDAERVLSQCRNLWAFSPTFPL